MKSLDLIKMIEADGWYQVRCKGDHHHFKHPTKKGLVTIPHPKRIYRQDSKQHFETSGSKLTTTILDYLNPF